MPPRRRLRETAPLSEDLTAGLAPDTTAEMTPLGRRHSRRQEERSVWPKRMAWLACGLLGLILIAPNLVGWLGLQQALIDWALADFDGKVQVKQLSLGWFQPISASGITVQDGTGQPLMEIDSVRSSQRLGGLLINRNLGHFEIRRPQVQLLVRYGGSNLEDALAGLIGQSESSAPTVLPPATLEIIDGQLSIAGSRAQESLQLAGIQIRVETATSLAAVIARMEAEVRDPRQSGKLTAHLQLDSNSPILNLADGNLELQAEQLPLASLGALGQRIANRVQVAGRLNGRAAMQFREAGQQATLELEQLVLEEAYLVAPELLGNDEFQLQQFTAQGKLAWQAGVASAEQFKASCDFGQLLANGQFGIAELTQLTDSGRLARTPFQLEGQLDLARLAMLLPETLHLHEDLTFDSGSLQFQVLSKPQADAARLLVNLDTTNFVARRAGAPIVWQQPLRLMADVIQQAGLPRLDQLLCRSDFLQIEGAADIRQAHLEVTGDLARLQQQLTQFVDLPGWQLAGDLRGELGWEVMEGASVAADAARTGSQLLPLNWSARGVVDQPLIGLPGQPVWSETRVEFSGGGEAAFDSTARCAVNSGSGAIQLGSEQLQWKLAEPIADLATAPKWVLECQLTGSLQRWLTQVRPWVDLTDWGMEGDCTVQTLLSFQWPTLELRNLDYQVELFRFTGFGLRVDEPKLQGQAQLAIDLEQGLTQIADLTLTSSSLAARGERLQLGYQQSGLQVAGRIGYRADVNRVAGWLDLSPTPESVQYFGTAEGTIRFDSQPQAIATQFDAAIAELLAAQPVVATTANPATPGGWTELLRENNVRLTGQLGIAPDFNRLQVEQLVLKSDSLGMEAKGAVGDLCGQMVLDVAGTWSPNWERVNGLLGAYSANLVQLQGRQTQAFGIRGPLFAAPGQPTALYLPLDLQVQTEIGWERGQVFHLPVGPASLEAHLVGGVATLNTGEIPFSEGRLHLAPKIDFRSESPVATLAAGPLAENIQLTPEICRDWLKYVAPLLADATSAQGRVSIATEGVMLPLADPLDLRVRGAVDLQQVTVGAGPLAQRLIETVQGVRNLLKPNQTESRDLTVWMQLEQQRVPFAVENRRVYHEGLAMHVKDFTIRTKGSVGLDQSLSLVAEIPIADDWLGSEPWLQGLKGQTLQIPVGGTVSRPVIDTKAVQQLTMQLVQRTAANQLNNVVGEQTQKLQGKVDAELNKFQNDLRSKFNSEVGGKLPTDLQNGLNSLFGPKKDK